MSRLFSRVLGGWCLARSQAAGSWTRLDTVAMTEKASCACSKAAAREARAEDRCRGSVSRRVDHDAAVRCDDRRNGFGR
jgi:hypothetical protein